MVVPSTEFRTTRTGCMCIGRTARADTLACGHDPDRCGTRSSALCSQLACAHWLDALTFVVAIRAKAEAGPHGELRLCVTSTAVATWLACRDELWKEPGKGYTLPLATGEHYHLWFGSRSTSSDFRSFNLQATDLRKGDHVWLTFNYTEISGYMGVRANGRHIKGSFDSFPQPGVNATGSFLRNFNTSTLTVLLDGESNTGGPDDWGKHQDIQ